VADRDGSLKSDFAACGLARESRFGPERTRTETPLDGQYPRPLRNLVESELDRIANIANVGNKRSRKRL